MNGVVFFDLEVALQPKEKIWHIGACFEEKTKYTNSIHDFEKFCQKATYLCGHNILAHDIPRLAKAGVSENFLRSSFIDTLYLSPLFFANKPYHRLIKDYQLMGDHLNDPVEDAKLAMGLLEDCIAAYSALPVTLQRIYGSLLQQEKEFAAFFQLLAGKAAFICNAALLKQEVLIYFKDHICENADIVTLINQRPIQLAYALALLNASDSASIIPPWLLYRYPDLTQVLHQLRANYCEQSTCHYCHENLSPVAGLRRYFGYEAFRKFNEKQQIPLQQQVVEAALRGESLIAIFPTGGGKSLTFQLPALIKGEASRGLTVVISPLQALMKDQVDVLRTRFDITKAIAINGLLSPLERADAIQTVREGGASLLYISPESLRSNTILNLLKGRHIERFVIDEAHCFSTWGHDFRVDYLYIGRFIKELAEAKMLKTPIPVSCFTATAKPEVVQDIQAYFKDQGELKVYQASTARENLSYYASKTDSKEAKLQQLYGLLHQVSEPAIVYVSRTKTAVQVAETLKKVGFNAEAFHGQMESEVKIRTQDSFIKGETSVMVATSAFGMGVDKENVKMVVHYDISDSLENYLQEAGRAGRKAGLEASCHLLFDENDLNQHFTLLNQTKLSRKEIAQIWKAVKDFKRTRFTRSALEIAKQAGWDTDLRDLETQVKAAIAALEDVGYVRRGQNAPRIFAKSILVRNVEAANKIIRDNIHLFSEKLEQQAIRIFQYLISRQDTQVDYMAEDLGIEKEDIVHILLHFKELRLLEDTHDLTALMNPVRSKKNTQWCLQQYAQTEIALLETLLPLKDTPLVRQIYLRDINERLIKAGCEDSTVEIIRTLLQFWEHQHYIYKERKEAHTMLYRIVFRQDRETLLCRIRARHKLAAGVVQWLCQQNIKLISSQKKTEEGALEFSIVKMKEGVESNNMVLANASLVDYEAVLLYLNFIGAIKLEGGLFVLYNPMTIERVENNPMKQYTKDDYAKLKRHYEKKIEQMHIIGEYARKQLNNHIEALRFVDDYFRLHYDDFINKYFKGQRGKLKQPITEQKFREIFGTLSEEQLAVVKDNESQNILVGAGPGSGKTRVLVHKVASLLIMEDIKPDQFLMLTFSRPAALEFKERLHQLLGNTAFHIDIFTYHGFAFRLLGRIGDLKRSENIIAETTQALREGKIAADRIKSKSVIVVDEYQDISRQEYDFLQVITGLADEVRVIVVGDDDQNIYEFRGSSVAFMQNFERQRKATRYILTRNYRSCANLVDFSNEFLSLFNADRLKAGEPLQAKNQTHGDIKITHYNPADNMVIPLVKDLASRRLRGTTAVLTATNEQALLVMSKLKEKEIPARLITNQEGFSLRHLLELKCFSHYLHQKVSNDLGYISPEDWLSCRELISGQFAASSTLPLALEVIETFGRTTANRRFWSDWLAFLQEIRSEDFAFPEDNKVLVSTMHKAKGKEFDHVFLLLSDYTLSSETKKRVVYVAITRARQTLSIHTDHSCFNGFSVPGLHISQETSLQADSFQIELGMKDVWLSFFKQPHVCQAIKPLQAGASLIQSPDISAGLTTVQGGTIVKYSRQFQEKLSGFVSKGYTCYSAEVAYIVVWYCEEDRKAYRVVLPRIILLKSSIEG